MGKTFGHYWVSFTEILQSSQFIYFILFLFLFLFLLDQGGLFAKFSLKPQLDC